MRWRRELGTDKQTIERICLVTSLSPGAATGSELAAWIRGHRFIENRLPHVRNHTFREDASKIRIWHLSRVMAGLRSCAIGVHRQNGRTNIAAALRRTARDLQEITARKKNAHQCGQQSDGVRRFRRSVAVPGWLTTHR
ncbi:hypothetical protein ACIA6T_18245 [Streptomyces sp. NPDC051740]|uniref:hypothetical protein n=1 Tax=Streptomyces sp. NPDC051740 TaxID=3365673 RepID=UPI0037931928